MRTSEHSERDIDLNFKKFDWWDRSTNTYCEIKLKVASPQNTLRIDIVQHGSKTTLYTVLPQKTTLKLLRMNNYDLETIAYLVKIVENNRIEVCAPNEKEKALTESLFQPITTRASSLMRKTF